MPRGLWALIMLRFFYVYLATVMLAAWAGKPDLPSGKPNPPAADASWGAAEGLSYQQAGSSYNMFIDFVSQFPIYWYILMGDTEWYQP